MMTGAFARLISHGLLNESEMHHYETQHFSRWYRTYLIAPILRQEILLKEVVNAKYQLLIPMPSTSKDDSDSPA